MFRKGRTPLLPNAGADQNVPLSRERRSGPKPEENIPMTYHNLKTALYLANALLVAAGLLAAACLVDVILLANWGVR